MASTTHDQAIVIGGSIAGLLAARVLAERFDRVTIIERDLLDDDPHRSGAPHARHLHVLLRRGLDAIEELLPGFERDLIAAGALRLQQGTDFRILFRSGWAPAEPGLQLVSMTRALLERCLRRRVLAHDRIAVANARVAGLLGDHRTVTGVLADREYRGALVVDASGRATRLPAWLGALGCEPPRETVVDAGWGYAMRVYRTPATPRPWKQLFITNRPPDQPRCAVVQPIEGDRVLLNAAGVMKDYPPTDGDALLDYVRSLPSREIYDAVRDAEPLGPVHGYRHTANRRYDFAALPARLIVLGDALCAFNPVYGQGMTVAVLEVLALRELLDAPLDKLGAKFQRRAASIIAGPWTFATTEDSRWPGTEGAIRGLGPRLMRRFIDRVIDTIPDSPEVYARFQLVQHMVRSPAALFHPSVLRHVLAPRRHALTAATMPRAAEHTAASVVQPRSRGRAEPRQRQ